MDKQCPIKSLFWRRKSKTASLDSAIVSTSDIGEDEEVYVRDNSSLLSLQPWVFRKSSFGSDEHVISSPPNSPSASFRGLHVSDGERSISRSRFGSLGFDRGSVVLTPPTSPKPRSEKRSKDVEVGKFDDSVLKSFGGLLCSQGSVDRVLFSLGVSIGVITTILISKVEVERLNKLVEHNEELVQDLHEQLEMRDSFSVKDLTYDTCQSLQRFDAKDEDGQLYLHKTGENSDQLSQIEAELEVELERLEQNINASDRLAGIPDFNEIDPDLICDLVQGELQARHLNMATSTSDSGTMSTNQAYNVNYSVPPKELIIRLHEVIEERLQERVEELERELEESQKQIHLLEGEKASSRRTFSYSEIDFSSNQDSPRLPQWDEYTPGAFSLNLSRDALNCYEEAYEEFMLMAGEEKPPVPPPSKGDSYKSNSWSISPALEKILWSRESDEESEKHDEALF